MSTTPKSSVTRRSVVKGAAWAVPAVTVAGAAPALAASAACTPATAETTGAVVGLLKTESRKAWDDAFWTLSNNGTTTPVPKGFTWQMQVITDLTFLADYPAALDPVELVAPIIKPVGDLVSMTYVTEPFYTSQRNAEMGIEGAVIGQIVQFTLARDLPAGESIQINLDSNPANSMSVDYAASSTAAEFYLGSYPGSNTVMTQGSQQMVVTGTSPCTAVGVILSCGADCVVQEEPTNPLCPLIIEFNDPQFEIPAPNQNSTSTVIGSAPFPLPMGVTWSITFNAPFDNAGGSSAASFVPTLEAENVEELQVATTTEAAPMMDEDGNWMASVTYTVTTLVPVSSSKLQLDPPAASVDPDSMSYEIDFPDQTVATPGGPCGKVTVVFVPRPPRG